MHAFYDNLIRFILIYQLFWEEKRYYVDCKTSFQRNIKCKK